MHDSWSRTVAFEVAKDHLLPKRPRRGCHPLHADDLLWDASDVELALFARPRFSKTAYGFSYLAPYDIQYNQRSCPGIPHPNLNALGELGREQNVVVVILDSVSI